MRDHCPWKQISRLVGKKKKKQELWTEDVVGLFLKQSPGTRSRGASELAD
jgi:hypothetical protein